jgi:hypothetical protein
MALHWGWSPHAGHIGSYCNQSTAALRNGIRANRIGVSLETLRHAFLLSRITAMRTSQGEVHDRGRHLSGSDGRTELWALFPQAGPRGLYLCSS